MSGFTYDSFLEDVIKGNIDVDTDSFKIMLTTNAYTADKVNHTKKSSVSNEITGAGYTTGGQAVVPTVTKDTVAHTVTITWPAVSWANSTISAATAVVYKDTGSAATSPLVFVNNFGSTVSTTNGTLTVQSSSMTYSMP